MWQHSACLGISQAEAEKDDFHFVCHICKRRAEDAKKPKIPALKFHVGSSSSPPSQKQKDLSVQANVSKKRKPGDSISNGPPMKKFKFIEIGNSQSNGSGLARPLNGEDSMRQVMMNGPTLAPQGQISRPNGNDATDQRAPPPPGLRDLSSGGTSSSNGYMPPHVGQRNGYYVESTTVSVNAAIVSPSGGSNPGGAGKTFSPGWSARYSSTQVTPQEPQEPQDPPTSHDPFLSSFERQRPSSSHASHTIPSPTKSHSSSIISPQIGNIRTVFGQAPQANGTPSHELPLPSTPRLPSSSFSPIKHQSSPPLPAVHSSPSSPSNNHHHHPILQQNPPSSPGFSPTKHSPPRSFAAADVNSTPVLPPVESLSPGPKVPNTLLPPPLSPPVKTKTANGDVHMDG